MAQRISSFDAVHCYIGASQHVCGRQAAIESGNARRRRNLCSGRFQYKWRCQRCHDFLGWLLGRRLIGNDDGKFVAANPRNKG
jgi:hypothetical protein